MDFSDSQESGLDRVHRATLAFLDLIAREILKEKRGSSSPRSRDGNPERVPPEGPIADSRGEEASDCRE